MRDIDIIIRNFEDGLIDEDVLTDILSLFDKSPDNFGYKANVSNEDEEEFNASFLEEAPMKINLKEANPSLISTSVFCSA